jgi:HEAT repeats/Tetratricopeptide repeat
MILQRLSLLLLGGCVSLSGFGCAAFQAATQRPTPVTASRHTSADRLVAIARVYENQGEFERAETLYRRALRNNPGDTVVRDRVAHLVARRQGRQFSAGPSATAIAAADAVNGAGRRSSFAKSADSVVTASATETQPKTVITVKTAESKPAPVVAVSVVETTPAPVVIADVAEPAPVIAANLAAPPVPVQPPAAVVESPPAPVEEDFAWADIAPLPPENPLERVTVGVSKPFVDLPAEIRVRRPVATPVDNVELLVTTLNRGQSSEEQAIAAVLLGECASDDIRVSTALAKSCDSALDMTVLLAVCDSQIQRNEHTARTAECLANIASRADDTELRVQATSALRHFAASESGTVCAGRLIELASSSDRSVRTAAVLTLGDFPNAENDAMSVLTLVAANDSEAGVRQAALYAMERLGAEASETVEVIGVGPKVQSADHWAGQPIQIVPAR